ncbi:peptidase C1, partial [bacterium]|nr:peptidase C1 [bacterium]
EDAAIIPTFDIPSAYIDQNAREFRFNNKTTSDDHDIHLVGYAKVGDYNWYLIKDSASMAQWGKYSGYLFYREDYIKLKMLTYIVHKNAVKAIIKADISR